MSDDFDELEPIDVSVEPTVETAVTEESPGVSSADPAAAAAPTSSWPPGWYSDPWTAGQYRYWTGSAWTGETNRWGPTNTGRGADAWPALTSPITSSYGLPNPAVSETTPVVQPRRRGAVVAGVIALVVLLLASAAVGYAIDSHSRSQNNAVGLPGSSTPTTQAPSTAPSTNPPQISTDPDRRVLGLMVVNQSDVGTTRTVVLIPNGNVTSQPTLDLCNGSFASERLRTARLQVATVDAQGNTALSTEAVLYRNPAAAALAFTELRQVRASCPHKPVVSPVKEATAETEFKAAPDTDWPNTPGVERQAYSFVSTIKGQASTSTVVYLHRGRAFLGLYFLKPSGAQAPIDGQRTIEGIVGIFEARLAKLPAAVVNRR